MAKGRSKTGASFEDLATSFKHGTFAPLYFFYGEEGLHADELQTLALEHAVQPHERDFNVDVVFGPEADARAVLAQCAQFPMMAERRLVIVRGFEKLDDNEAFRSYAEAPNPQAVVMLVCYDKPNLSKHPYRALKQHAVWAEFKAPYARELPGWAEKRFRARGVETESGAAAMLAELAGADLRTVASEVEKLVTYVGERRRVTRDDVLRAAGHSAEQNPFELQKAVVAGDVARALGIADALLATAANTHGEAIKLVALLASYIGKLWRLTGCLAAGVPEAKLAGQVGVPPFYVREYIAAARRYGPAAQRAAFGTLLAADVELKGGSQRPPRAVLTLALRRLARAAG